MILESKERATGPYKQKTRKTWYNKAKRAIERCVVDASVKILNKTTELTLNNIEYYDDIF